MPEQNAKRDEKYPLEVGGICYILGPSTNDSRHREGGAYRIVEGPTKKRQSYKLTALDRPGAYYLYYRSKDLISIDDPTAIEQIIKAGKGKSDVP
jgi:hypothetical protein